MDRDKFVKHRKDLVGPSPGKSMIYFIDDLNMPNKDLYGT